MMRERDEMKMTLRDVVEKEEMLRDGVWEEMVRQAWRDYVNTVNREDSTNGPPVFKTNRNWFY